VEDMLKTKKAQSMEITITNVYGKKVYQNTIDLQKGINKHTLPVHHLKPGQYLLQLKGPGQLYNRKFVKTK